MDNSQGFIGLGIGLAIAGAVLIGLIIWGVVALIKRRD